MWEMHEMEETRSPRRRPSLLRLRHFSQGLPGRDGSREAIRMAFTAGTDRGRSPKPPRVWDMARRHHACNVQTCLARALRRSHWSCRDRCLRINFGFLYNHSYEH
jgi:hypothetical protein